MGDFFQGWRRKLGCVSLVLAVLLMVGWVRSHLLDDIIRPIHGQPSLVLASSNDSLFFGLIWNMPPFPFWDADESNTLKSDLESDPNFKWSARLGGFGVGSIFNDPVSAVLLIVPYWLVVMPLTILSAWLLLKNHANHGNRRRKISFTIVSPHRQWRWRFFRSADTLRSARKLG